MRRRPRPSKTVAFIKRWRVFWAWLTLVLYIAAIPFTIIVFPSNSLWLGLLVLFSGFTASLTTLGDLLVSAEESVREDVETGTEDPSSTQP